LRGLTCRRVDRKCDGHTHTHQDKFIFCPCIALDRQLHNWSFRLLKIKKNCLII